MISASLKTTCPSGVYVAPVPGDTTQWHAVLFVRDGLYAPAILRFRINFPKTYPVSPPVVVFETDIFHPLLVPLTTHSYISNSTEGLGRQQNGQDDLVLPPGGFSLRGMRSEGQWQTCDKDESSSEVNKVNTDDRPDNYQAKQYRKSSDTTSLDNVTEPHASQGSNASQRYLVAEVLYYIKRAFSSSAYLDSILLADAVNPGAFFAWRSHRLRVAPSLYKERQEKANHAYSSQFPARSQMDKEDSPNVWSGQWNWDGVWKDRVQKAVQASIAGSTLFGDVNNENVVSI